MKPQSGDYPRRQVVDRPLCLMKGDPPSHRTVSTKRLLWSNNSHDLDLIRQVRNRCPQQISTRRKCFLGFSESASCIITLAGANRFLLVSRIVIGSSFPCFLSFYNYKVTHENKSLTSTPRFLKCWSHLPTPCGESLPLHDQGSTKPGSCDSLKISGCFCEHDLIYSFNIHKKAGGGRDSFLYG